MEIMTKDEWIKTLESHQNNREGLGMYVLDSFNEETAEILAKHDKEIVVNFAEKIRGHLSEVENSIVEQRNNSKTVANSQMLIGMQMCIEDFLGWLDDNTSKEFEELTEDNDREI